MLIFQKMLTLFFLMAVGFVFRKKSWINEENSGLLSKIVLNVANPAMMIAAGMNSETTISNQTLIATFITALIFYAILIVTAPLVMRLLRIPEGLRGTYQYMYIFGNIGFMGMPLITSIYGSEYALLVALFNFVFSMLMYTYGIYLVKKEARINGKSTGEEKPAASPLRNLINAGTVGCIVAMIFFLTKLPVPDFIYNTFEMCSNLAGPLSMFVIGSSLAAIEPKALISDHRLNLFIVVRLFLIPIIGIGLARLLQPGELLLRVFYVMISVPFASTSVLIAGEYGGDMDSASKGVAFSTLVSVISLPIVGMIFGM